LPPLDSHPATCYNTDMTTTSTITVPPVTIPANANRYAYAYGWVASCMMSVELYAKDLETATNNVQRTRILQRIMDQVQYFKAMDDCLHKEDNK